MAIHSNKLMMLVGAVALAAVITGCGRLNSRIDQTIEEVGTDLTEVPVEVDKVKIRFGGGSGEIKGLTVGSPDGYLMTNSFDMDLLRLNIGLFASLGGPPIVIDELVIDSPVLTLELNEEGGSNLRDIADNVKNNLARAEAAWEEAERDSDKVDKKPVRIAVRRLVIEGVSFNLRRRDGTFRSGTLPAIELTGVGGKEGKTPVGLGAVVILAMAGEILKQAVAHQLVEGFRFDADKILAYLEQRLSLATDQLPEMKGVVEDLTVALNDVLDKWGEQGFVELKSLSDELEPVTREVVKALENVLDSEQLQEFERILSSLDQEALEAIRNALIERLVATLGITDAQLEQLRPILREHLEQLGQLLNRFVASPDRSFEDFRQEYTELQVSTRDRLEGVLDAEQLSALTRRQDEIRERIRGLVFEE